MDEQQIAAYFKGQMHHELLYLKIEHTEQIQLNLIGQSLSKITNLSALDIKFDLRFFNKTLILKDLFVALESLSNLSFFSFEIPKLQFTQFNFNFENMVIQFAQSLGKVGSLTIFHFNIKQASDIGVDGSKQLGKCLKKLKNLQVLQIDLLFLNHFKKNDEIISNLQKRINKLDQLTSYQLNVEALNAQIKQINDIGLKFRDLNHMKEFKLNLQYNFKEINTINNISYHLQCFASIIKIDIQITGKLININITDLLNSMLQLNTLEECSLYTDVEQSADEIIIGQKMNSESNIRKLSLIFYNTVFRSSIKVLIAKNAHFLKNLIDLTLSFTRIQMETSNLASWVEQWKNLKNLKIEMIIYDQSIEILNILGKCFKNLLEIKQLILDIQVRLTHKNIDNYFINSLSSMQSLESLITKSLQRFCNSDASSYSNCFEKKNNLRELDIQFIDNEEELLFLGKSFQYLSNLTILKISINDFNYFKYFDAFCNNLKLLVNLVHFTMNCIQVYMDSEANIDEKNIKFLLVGIQQLKNLKQFIFNSQIEAESCDFFVREFPNHLKGLDNLHVLQIDIYLNQNQRELSQKIMRSCNRLVNMKI